MKPEIWEKIPPYFAVDTRKETRSGSDDKFWESGERDVTTIESAVRLKSPVLDFGCGTGRISRALVRRGYEVIAYDHSLLMREECKKNVPEASVVGKVKWSRPASIVSMICIQHIPKNEVENLLPFMLCIPTVAIHFLTHDKRGALTRMLWKLSYQPGFSSVSNLLRGRPINEPRIPLHFFPEVEYLGLRKISLDNEEFCGGIFYRNQ